MSSPGEPSAGRLPVLTLRGRPAVSCHLPSQREVLKIMLTADKNAKFILARDGRPVADAILSNLLFRCPIPLAIYIGLIFGTAIFDVMSNPKFTRSRTAQVLKAHNNLLAEFSSTVHFVLKASLLSTKDHYCLHGKFIMRHCPAGSSHACQQADFH